MIVEPDFLTHWKTGELINELDDKCAPLYLLALWSHCQLRKSDRFAKLSPAALKAICRYEGDAGKLFSTLQQTGWIEVEGDTVVVHGWAETNARLFQRWEAGKKGGRPKTEKEPDGNRKSNPVNRAGTDRVDREEKIDKNNTPKVPNGDGYSEEFEKFWSAYPQKVGKGGAWKAWKRINHLPAIGELLRIVEENKRQNPKWKDGFIPNPQTWLNQSRWLDSVQPELGKLEQKKFSSCRPADEKA